MCGANNSDVLKETSPVYGEGDIDLSLLKDSLSKTPWQRMLSNDDALNFADSLQAAVKKRNANPRS